MVGVVEVTDLPFHAVSVRFGDGIGARGAFETLFGLGFRPARPRRWGWDRRWDRGHSGVGVVVQPLDRVALARVGRGR